MQVADESTVLGDFSDSEFDYYGKKTQFTTRNNEYFVRTENADGVDQDFRVTYTFGITPLQQYLVEFPGGRMQALPYTWDSRPADEGGQRWYHLYPDEYIEPGDELHWTGRLQNWNYMCAECHSTNLARNYDPATDSYGTTFSEVDVSCEACHGPGSNHVRWAEAPDDDPAMGLVVRLKDSDGGAWVYDDDTGNAKRSQPRGDRGEIEACGRCHARRSPPWDRSSFSRSLPNARESRLFTVAIGASICAAICRRVSPS